MFLRNRIGDDRKGRPHDHHRHRQRPARPFGLPGRERLRDQPLHRPGPIVDARRCAGRDEVQLPPLRARESGGDPRRRAGVQARPEGRPGADPLLVGRRVRARRDSRASPSSRRPPTGSSGRCRCPSPCGISCGSAANSRSRRSSGSSAATAASSSSLSRERGTVYRSPPAGSSRSSTRARRRRGQHSQGGWSQARYQRHIEHLVQQHLKTVGQEIDKQARGAGGLQMVVVAPEELRSEIESTLSTEAREAVVGWATAEAHAGADASCSTVVRPLLDEARARARAGGARALAGGARPRRPRRRGLEADARRSLGRPRRRAAARRELGRPRGVGVPEVRSCVRRRRQVRARRHEARAGAGRRGACDPPRDRARRLRSSGSAGARSATPPGVGAILRY